MKSCCIILSHLSSHNMIDEDDDDEDRDVLLVD
jgi:hypothetical protein